MNFKNNSVPRIRYLLDRNVECSTLVRIDERDLYTLLSLRLLSSFWLSVTPLKKRMNVSWNFLHMSVRLAHMTLVMHIIWSIPLSQICSEVCRFHFLSTTYLILGSIIRCMRRLEETLRQMVQAAKAIGNTELENKFSEGELRPVFTNSLKLGKHVYKMFSIHITNKYFT